MAARERSRFRGRSWKAMLWVFLVGAVVLGGTAILVAAWIAPRVGSTPLAAGFGLAVLGAELIVMVWVGGTLFRGVLELRSYGSGRQFIVEATVVNELIAISRAGAIRIEDEEVGGHHRSGWKPLRRLRFRVLRGSEVVASLTFDFYGPGSGETRALEQGHGTPILMVNRSTEGDPSVKDLEPINSAFASRVIT
jgi:hypothetical protein